MEKVPGCNYEKEKNLRKVLRSTHSTKETSYGKGCHPVNATMGKGKE